MKREVLIPQEYDGARLDVALSTLLPELSRSQAARLIGDGQVVVQNAESVRTSYRVHSGQSVVVTMPAPSGLVALPEPIELSIIYENEQLAVIDKPAGMVVHPAAGHVSGTLVNAALHRFGALPSPSGALRSGIVHRLDKETSGLIVVAKTDAALVDLQMQFKRRSVEKEYVTLVRGRLNPVGSIDLPLGRDPKNRKRMAVATGGRTALTEFALLSQYRAFALARVLPRTGRTHQIRVHMAANGTPVAGDALYGDGSSLGLTRQFLHARRLAVTLPGTENRLICTSVLPRALLEALRVAGDPDPLQWAGATDYRIETAVLPADRSSEPDAQLVESA